MRLFGKFTAYCSYCGKKVETTCDGFGMWRVAGKWMVCDKECHERLSLVDARSILGKDTEQELEQEGVIDKCLDIIQTVGYCPDINCHCRAVATDLEKCLSALREKKEGETSA